MRCKPLILTAICAAVSLGAGSAVWANFAGPNIGITGNDTGGIFPYSPAVEKTYRGIAAAHCARWHRLSYVTSVHRQYGDYVSFVCIDKPGMIH